MGRWVINLCGPLALERDGTALGDGVPGRQGKLLLAWLVLHRDHATSRSRLIDLLWPEAPPAAADGALSALLSKLRRCLGEGALTGRTDLTLSLGPEVEVDTERLEEALKAACAAAAAGDWPAAATLSRVALATTHGEFLPDCDGPWAQERREELADARVRAHETLAEAARALGDLDEAEQAARAAATAAPWREPAHRLLMEVHEAAGNPAEALRVFDALRRRLRADLGIAPGRETLAVHERLLRGEPAPVHGPGANSLPFDGHSPGLPAPLVAALDRPELIGRARALEALEQAWRQAATGQGRMALIAGEAGIGKTRVAAEFARRAAADGAAVLYGRCDEDRLAPFQPIGEMLRSAGAAGVAERLGELARDLDQVAGLFSEIAAGRPLLLVIDDLHWADRPTLALLHHLARGPNPRRTLLLGTHRETRRAGAADDALAGLVATLRREGPLNGVVLLGLSPEQVGALVTSVAGRSAPESFVNALHAETDGNPFFVEEVVRHLAGSSARLDPSQLRAAGVPEGVREVTGQRLARLGDEARDALLAAAVVGREFDFGLLEAVVAIDGDRLVEILERAVDAGMLREVPGQPGVHQFAHALVRATLLDHLSALRRARLHSRVGEAILARCGDDTDAWLPALSRHFAEAAPLEAPDRSAYYALAAAHRAERLHAWEEAAAHYRRTLRARTLAGAPRDREYGELQVSLGEAEDRSGLASARSSFAEAIAIARSLDDTSLLARATLGFAGPWSTLGLVDDDVVDLLEEALDALGTGAGDPERCLRARLLARLTLELYYVGDPVRRLALSAEAVALAREAADPATLAVCLDARHYALWQPENVRERLEVAQELRRVARAHGDPELELEGLGWMAVDQLELGDIAAFDALVGEAGELAEQVNRPLYRWWASLFRCTRVQISGDLAEAERLAGETLAIGLRGHADNAMHYYGQSMFNVRREQGRLAEVEEAVRSFVRQYPLVPAWRGVLALALVELDRPEEAREHFAALAGPSFAGIPRDANWLIAITLAAEVCAALDDEAAAAELYTLLEPYAERNVVVGRASACNGSAARQLGLLAGTLGRWEDADTHFAAALAMHERMGARALAARTKVDWARVLLGHGRAEDVVKAEALLADATALADGLGLRAVGDAARALALA